ncbi:MAG: tetratricopeptide repeat protein [Bacteroidales bacterium]|jgi:tetratricopeptide (TPR) repeat protein|nr:tetratricopeptide repeat protein [Bacteroidales bacterium]
MAKAKGKTEDKIVAVEEALSRTERLIEANQKIIMIVIASIIVLVLGYLAYNKFYQAPREERAKSEIFNAESFFEADSLDLALNGDGNHPGFLEIIDNYSSTTSGNLAKYYAGLCYLKKGEFETALSYLKKFDTDNVMVGSMATGAMGDASLELGQTEKAVSCYMDAAQDFPNEFTSPMFLQKAGMAWELLGNYKKAVEVYKIIKESYPKSYEGRDVEKFIARAEGLLQ